MLACSGATKHLYIISVTITGILFALWETFPCNSFLWLLVESRRYWGWRRPMTPEDGCEFELNVASSFVLQAFWRDLEAGTTSGRTTPQINPGSAMTLPPLWVSLSPDFIISRFFVSTGGIVEPLPHRYWGHLVTCTILPDGRNYCVINFNRTILSTCNDKPKRTKANKKKPTYSVI